MSLYDIQGVETRLRIPTRNGHRASSASATLASSDRTTIILQIYDHIWLNEVMSQAVKVSELKAKLSGYLAQVRRGGTVTVCDRKTPIARLVPVVDQTGGLIVREAIDPESPLLWRRIKLKKQVDVVEMLRADRTNR